MRTNLWFGVMFSTSVLAACGGSGPSDSDAPPGIADAPPVADAPPGPPDADPNAPDAVPGAFTCNGQPNPTVADATVDVIGTTVEISFSGYTAVPGATVELFAQGNPTPVATTTSAGAMADFSFLGLPTGGVALDGYLKGTFPGGRKTVYVYPPQPIFETIDNTLVTSVSQGIIDLLNVLIDEDQTAENGAVGVLVTDCLGNPLAGAVISTTPAGTSVLYRDADGNPDPAATSTGPDGIGIVINVPPGNAVTVDAAYQSYNMREHVIAVRTIGAPDNSISTTIVKP
jgi:hypothetical protein